MTEEHGLSREQVEALTQAAKAMREVDWRLGSQVSHETALRAQVAALAPTLAAMLADAEKRGEDRGRAEVVREVQAALDLVLGEMNAVAMLTINAALARHTATAAQEGTTEPLGASGGSAAGGSESPRAADGRTGPRTDEDARAADAARRLREVQERALGTCGEQHGGLDMACQLRRGHDGPPEDWSAVAKERLA